MNQSVQPAKPTVASLLERIEQNQQIQARFHDYEFELMACRRLPELLGKLIHGAMTHFELAEVSLALHDPDYRLATLREHIEFGDCGGRLRLQHGDELFRRLYGERPRVRLGPISEDLQQLLLPDLPTPGSAALLPLMRGNSLTGSLHFGSASPARYTPDMAVSFMWHLASTVAICLENCVALEQLQRQGQEDILTRVRNRRCFEQEFSKELERAERQQHPLSCVFADIDYFKQINDSFGHQLGDRCLRLVAEQISRELRKTDMLARYGGEEFVILLPACDRVEALQTAERVRLAVANAPLALAEGESIPLTISLGLASWQPGAERNADLKGVGEELLRQADLAMYEAKDSGRNRVCVAG